MRSSTLIERCGRTHFGLDIFLQLSKSQATYCDGRQQYVCIVHICRYIGDESIPDIQSALKKPILTDSKAQPSDSRVMPSGHFEGDTLITLTRDRLGTPILNSGKNRPTPLLNKRVHNSMRPWRLYRIEANCTVRKTKWHHFNVMKLYTDTE